MVARGLSRRVGILWLSAAVVAAAILAAQGYRNATASPLLRRVTVTVPDYPSASPPVTIALFADVHVHGPDMPPERVGQIVRQVDALNPDIIVAGGDFVGNSSIGRSYSVAASIAPLRHLHARLGVYAVLGNNDYRAGTAAVRHALHEAGLTVLEDRAVRAGPVALGGLDGRIHHGPDWDLFRKKTYAALDRTPGVQVLVAHRPDEFIYVPPSVKLVLAGHTHCGQIVLPLVGALATGSDYGSRFLCGAVREGSKLLIVTAGVGTSHVPLRFGTSPDIWLITIQASAESAASKAERGDATGYQ